MRNHCPCPLWIAWIGPGEYFSARWNRAGAGLERSIRLEYSDAGRSTANVRRYVEEMATEGSRGRRERESGDTEEAIHIRHASMGPGDTFCTVYGESVASSHEDKAIAAFVLCNEAGLPVCVGIPNPSLSDAAMEASRARSIATIELEGTAERTARSFFSDPRSVDLEIKELVRAIADRYRIDQHGRLAPRRV